MKNTGLNAQPCIIRKKHELNMNGLGGAEFCATQNGMDEDAIRHRCD